MMGANPKDLVGDKKTPYKYVPKVGIAVMARVMELGAKKYGPYNWRDNTVRMTVYIDAARRHLDLLEYGEDTDEESKVDHAAHVMACMNILLDAAASGNLMDDRYKDPGVVAMLHQLNGELPNAEE